VSLAASIQASIWPSAFSMQVGGRLLLVGQGEMEVGKDVPATDGDDVDVLHTYGSSLVSVRAAYPTSS